MRALQRLFHERGGPNLASHVHILAQIQTLPRRVGQPQLDRLSRLSWHIPAHTPLVANIQPRWRVDMRLEAPRKVIEASLVTDFPLDQPAREVGYSVGDLVPGAMVFVGGRGWRRLTSLVVDDQRIQLDHLGMIVQGCHDGFPGDVGGEWGDGGEDRAFVHVDMNGVLRISLLMITREADVEQRESR